jgi:hypothetical protein
LMGIKTGSSCPSQADQEDWPPALWAAPGCAATQPGMAWNLELQHLLWQVSNPRLPRARLSVETKNLENVFPRVRTHAVRVQSRRLAHFAKLADDKMDARLILRTLGLTLQRETCIVSRQQQAGPTLAA